jgi:hypothetical protein
MSSWRKGAFEMHIDDGIPLVFGHVRQHPVAQNAGIVHQNMQHAKVLDGLVHHVGGTIPTRDIISIGNCLATHRLDLGDNLLCCCQVATLAVSGASHIVDYDLGALASELDRVTTSDPTACAGHDDYLVVTDSHVFP